MALTQEKVDALTEKLTSVNVDELDIVAVNAELKAQGIEISDDELKEYYDLLEKNADQGELDEESLDEVSGGRSLKTIVTVPVINPTIIVKLINVLRPIIRR